MATRAVIVDVGSVLEVVEPPEDFLERWRRRLGLDPAAFAAALDTVDPDHGMAVGRLSEAGFRSQVVSALDLDPDQADAFMRDLWDWYCGEPDTDLIEYVRSLRPRVATAILSNSADGARREEQARYGFEDLVDTVVYSHEIGVAKPDPRAYEITCTRLGVHATECVFLDDVEANVAAARALGMFSLLHRDTPSSIAAIDAALGR